MFFGFSRFLDEISNQHRERTKKKKKQENIYQKNFFSGFFRFILFIRNLRKIRKHKFRNQQFRKLLVLFSSRIY